MGKRATVHDEWIVKLDEFHPDPRVAAKYADQEARLTARRHLSDRIKALLTKTEPLSTEEAAELESARYHLRITNEAIAEFEKEDA